MRIVETTADLQQLVGELEAAPYIALDTEFMRDQTYWPKLCLMQVAARGGPAAIIDPLADGLDLAPIYGLIGKPDVVKVLHAARQDIEIFWHQGGVIPHPLFDTQMHNAIDAVTFFLKTPAQALADVETKVMAAVQQFKQLHPGWPNE